MNPSSIIEVEMEAIWMAESVLLSPKNVSRISEVEGTEVSYHVWAKNRTLDGIDISSRSLYVVTTSSSSGFVATRTEAK